MFRRETFSIWHALGVVTIALAVLAPRMLCRSGPSKQEIAKRIVDHATHLRFLAWSRSHDGCPRFTGELLDEPVDPWGRPYRVICVVYPPHVVITSAGEDGRFGTADDIASNRAP
jgi:hypothetical protein